jgi:oxygen-dependent protoporphyrinogen oxidase
MERIEQSRRQFPGLYLTGNGYRGLGLPDCIAQAEAVAECLLEEIRGSSPDVLRH